MAWAQIAKKLVSWGNFDGFPYIIILDHVGSRSNPVSNETWLGSAQQDFKLAL